MRIVSGKFKGRRLEVAEKIRPTSEKVREAIFSSLQSIIDLSGLNVIDLYAGTGAWGFEALSRGAESLTIVEKELSLVKSIAENAKILGIEKSVKLKSGEVFSELRRLQDEKYQLVFADPPYAEHPGDLLVEQILASNIVASNSLIVIESNSKQKMSAEIQALNLSARKIKEKTYGDTAVHYYKLD